MGFINTVETGQAVDVEPHPDSVGVVEGEEPVTNLWFEPKPPPT